MKTTQEVDSLMATVPESWRYRWCGGERGPCACMGCVQIGNRYAMVKATTGRHFPGDPEYINESQLPAEIVAKTKITREEWLAWKQRHPTPRPPHDH